MGCVIIECSLATWHCYGSDFNKNKNIYAEFRCLIKSAEVSSSVFRISQMGRAGVEGGGGASLLTH